MARYIDADAATELARLTYCKDCNSYNGVMCRACAFDDAMSFIDDFPESEVVPKSEVGELSDRYEDLKLKYIDLAKDHGELLDWGGHIKSKDKAIIRAEVAREILEELEREIEGALKSNYFVLPQIEESEALWNRVHGKIDTLRGIGGFIEELKEKYTEKGG